MYTWQVVCGSNGRVEVVEGYETLDEAIADMANYRDDTSNQWGNFITDESDKAHDGFRGGGPNGSPNRYNRPLQSDISSARHDPSSRPRGVT